MATLLHGVGGPQPVCKNDQLSGPEITRRYRHPGADPSREDLLDDKRNLLTSVGKPHLAFISCYEDFQMPLGLEATPKTIHCNEKTLPLAMVFQFLQSSFLTKLNTKSTCKGGIFSTFKFNNTKQGIRL